MWTREAILSDLETVRTARLFFAHHSVGQNLLDGVQELGDCAQRPLKIVPADQAGGEGGAVWLEASGGANKDPRSKIDHFVATLTGPAALNVQLAFLKLCYVDFHPRTDVDSLFAYYDGASAALKRQRPDVTLGHVTVPLTTQPRDPKSCLRRLMRLEIWEDLANVRRCEFNRRLLERYSTDPIFDLARGESTRPDGTRQTFLLGGRTYQSLVAEYTNDGGHLNAMGQRLLGADLIRFAAAALRRTTSASAS